MAGQLGDFSGAARLWGAAREQEESSVPGETNPARGKAGCRMGPFPAAPSGLGTSFGHKPCKMWAPEPSNAQGWAERGKKREAEAAKAPSAPAQHRSGHLLAASPPALPPAGWGRGGGRTPSSSWHLLAWGLFIREHRKLNRSLSLSLSLSLYLALNGERFHRRPALPCAQGSVSVSMRNPGVQSCSLRPGTVTKSSPSTPAQPRWICTRGDEIRIWPRVLMGL